MSLSGPKLLIRIKGKGGCMNERYLEQWTEIAKNIQRPFQAILELNVKTLESFKYLKPEDLAKIKNPEELLEKQVNYAIENGHRALDYFQRSFEIFEQILGPLTESVKRSTQSTMDTAKSLKTFWNPGKLTMAPTRAAIDLTKPLLDPSLSAMDPAKAVEELASSALSSPKLSAKKTKLTSAGAKKTKKSKE